MPSVPAIGEVTVCEINRDFLTKKDDGDIEAHNAYSRILGHLYLSIPFTPPQIGVTGSGVVESLVEEKEGREGTLSAADVTPSTSESRNFVEETGQRGFLANKFFSVIQSLPPSLKCIYPSPDPEVLRKLELFQGISWHKHKQFLAFLSGTDQVVVYDFEDSESKDPSVLYSDSQKGVAAIEWRPNAGTTLSVACRGGICIWTASFPGSIAPVRSGVVSFLGTPARGTGARWALVDFLQNPGHHPVTALSWSPSGRLLASASWEDSEFMIWDVAQGIGTPLRRGLGGVSILKWSPKGDYLFSAKLDGTFHFWETNNWTSEKWFSTGGPVVSAMWSPDDNVLLSAFDQTTTLGALHFAGKPPSLDAHLLPIDLPEIESITGGLGKIEKIAWDGSGERLAMSFSGGDAIYSGLIAIFDTRKSPIVSVSLLGFLRGPGSGVKPLAFAFHDQLKQGVLLSVCWSTGICCTYPLLFK